MHKIKRRYATALFCLSLIFILSLSVVSAFSFSELWGKITGKPVSTSGSYASGIKDVSILNIRSWGDSITPKEGSNLLTFSGVYGNNGAGGANDFAYYTWTGLEENNYKDYVVKQGDVLSFWIYALEGVGGFIPCGVEIDFTDGSTSLRKAPGHKDQDGILVVSGNLKSNNAWYQRRIDISDMAGKTIKDGIKLVQEYNKDSGAQFKCLFDGIKIENPQTATTPATTTTTRPATTTPTTTTTTTPATTTAALGFGEEIITFGQQTPGTHTQLDSVGLDENNKYVSSFNLLQSGSVTKLSIYVQRTMSSELNKHKMKGVIYSNNNGPNQLLGITNELLVPSGQTPGWVDMNFATPINLTAGSYWLGVISGGGLIHFRPIGTPNPNTGDYLRFITKKSDTYSDDASSSFEADAPGFETGAQIAGTLSIYATVITQAIYVKNGKLGIKTNDPKAFLDIKGGGSGNELLRFSTDRAWVFKQSGSDSNTILDLHSISPDKKFRITSEDGSVIFQVNAFNGANNGKVGVGKGDPSEALDVNGNVKATGFLYSSDEKLKKNILPLANSLEKIKLLDGVSFEWKDNNRKDIGVIAQDVEKVFPEIVSTDDAGLKSVEYGNLVAPLIESVKELNAKLEAQKLEIQRLREEIEKLKG